jgi:hypothetical protein
MPESSAAGPTTPGRPALFPPFAGPGMRARQSQPDGGERFPAIEQYLDDLPSIADFLEADPVGDLPVADVPAADISSASPGIEFEPLSEPAAAYENSPTAPENDEEGWAATGWQSYDWGALASLGVDPDQAVADRAWRDTEWEGPAGSAGSNQGGPVYYDSAEGNAIGPNADEVAAALDGIARRIRSGELVIDNLRGTPPEAAMAAALAVLLRMRG